jgi:nuclear pore complex protein Nup50
MFADKKNTSSDSSKPAFQFGGNNVIFGGKKDAPVDSSKPFQFGPNNGIFGDKKDTPSDSSKPFHFGANKGIFGDKKTTSGDSSNPFQFGANNGFPTSNAPSIFSSVGQSFNPQSPPLFSMNQQSVLPGIFSDFFLCCLLHTYDGLILGQG